MNTYTVDRYTPYKNSASYKGISRVLQGFEVVLLSVLTKEVVHLKGVPLSLDHDGLMALFILDENVELENDFIQHSYNCTCIENILTSKLEPWAEYLLKSSVPVEVKRHWFQGDVTEY